MIAYYNEFNPEAAAMLRQLIADGHCAPGIVDERSITEVTPDDLKPYTQCHFFAGIGGWSIALRLAGWPDDRPVWTGSAPCQPFSSAGKQKGKDDERHLFPAWLGLIRECRPATIFGEQVASSVAHGWLDDVYQGLEAEGYAVGAAVLPACSVGAPHKRDRLWFVAHAEGKRGGGTSGAGSREVGRPSTDDSVQFGGTSANGDVAYADFGRRAPVQQSNGSGEEVSRRKDNPFPPSSNALAHSANQRGDVRGNREHCGARPAEWQAGRGSSVCDMDNPQQPRLEGHPRHGGREEGWQEPQRPATEAGFWSSGQWLSCADQKHRLVEPSISLLADGVQHRRPILHAIGNAIVPQVAAEFIKASM